MTAPPALSENAAAETKQVIDAPLGPGLTIEQVRQNSIVDKYVLSKKAAFPQMSPSVEWDDRLIKFAATAPIPEALLALDGDRVDTLTVKVMESRFSNDDYTQALHSLTGSGKLWGRQVKGVRIPADMQTIPVMYKGLSELDASERAALEDEMTGVAELPIVLVDYPDPIW